MGSEMCIRDRSGPCGSSGDLRQGALDLRGRVFGQGRGQAAEGLDGAARPGHFDGVATIVSKLFIATMPNVAIFGEKDWQQLAVIRRMNADLGLPIEIIGHPTIREEDGLAMSSRNALLSREERETAPALFQLMGELAGAVAGGANPVAEIARATGKLREAGFGPIDYLAYVDGDSLEPLDHYQEGGRLIAAAYLGSVRLIDNMRVISDTV